MKSAGPSPVGILSLGKAGPRLFFNLGNEGDVFMKKLLTMVAALLLFSTPLLAQDAASTPAAGGAAPADTAAPAPMKKAKAHMAGGDEAGVQQAFSDFATAWASGDATTISSFFTFDATFINPMGTEGQGMAGIQKVIAADLAGPMAGTTQAFSDFGFVWVMNNMALVDCTATVTGMKNPDGSAAGPTPFHIYSVMVNRNNKGWKARAVRAYAFMQPPSTTGGGKTPGGSTGGDTPPASGGAATPTGN
jgi:uncharacterized protein (TIGR02246 family)